MILRLLAIISLKQHSYLPTMAEDNLQEVRRVMGGQFYGNEYTCINLLVTEPSALLPQHAQEVILTLLERLVNGGGSKLKCGV